MEKEFSRCGSGEGDGALNMEGQKTILKWPLVIAVFWIAAQKTYLECKRLGLCRLKLDLSRQFFGRSL